MIKTFIVNNIASNQPAEGYNTVTVGGITTISTLCNANDPINGTTISAVNPMPNTQTRDSFFTEPKDMYASPNGDSPTFLSDLFSWGK